ncbi:MAG: tRNA preQ1(34) S-adenosylmethionine ribosyltransferase-isomerase QueA [Anaerofustis sp.]
MKTIDFDYELPQELIAQTPLQDRASSKLLVVDRVTGMLEDRHFYDVLEYLNEGDCLVVNDSKVLPARIYGIKRETQAKIEFLLVKQLGTDRWRVMAKPAKRLKIGTIVDFDEKLTATVINKREDGLLEVQFQSEGSLFEALHRIGTMPLPPYIKTKLKDQNRYQTIYADKEGSSAAPTAGLHFTEELLHEIEEKGVKIAKITLHVGLGTFLPVSEDEITEHKMHSEYYEISQDAADLINRTKNERHRVIAVGTTSVRTLESCAERNDGKITAETRETDIFIYPGFQFRVVDHLITNFHLPKSTLLMLISAFYDREKILEVYRYAVQQQYRFFSFGDAMLIL